MSFGVSLMFRRNLKRSLVPSYVLSGFERLLNVLTCFLICWSLVRHSQWFGAIQYSFCLLLGISSDVLGCSETFKGVFIGSEMFLKVPRRFFFC